MTAHTINPDSTSMTGVHPQMVDFNSKQGRKGFSAAGAVLLRRGLENLENAVWDKKMPFVDGH
jgi:hypothetical protein